MAVYTRVPASELKAFLERYDVGEAVSFAGIAEGVENSNFLLGTTRGRYILTLYEKRVAAADLPYFLSLMRHAAERGVPTARPVPDRAGEPLRTLCGRPAALIEFLDGAWTPTPTPQQAGAAAAALGRFHRATADFPLRRRNALGPKGWAELAARIGGRADEIAPGLDATIAGERAMLDRIWPATLPIATTHADLFPDNVLFLDGAVSGLIDFYFACTELRAYDLAVMLVSWAFDAGDRFLPEHADALIEGYHRAHGLLPSELSALPVLARGACLRFLLTRAWDWLNTPADALVTRKDPLSFARRLAHFAGE
ncbi:MAG: homoserine kinase [Sphingomonadaceae bacterium]|nr:homoserine kinase [Sphingomonadaceae bacterium]